MISFATGEPIATNPTSGLFPAGYTHYGGGFPIPGWGISRNLRRKSSPYTHDSDPRARPPETGPKPSYCPACPHKDWPSASAMWRRPASDLPDHTLDSPPGGTEFTARPQSPARLPTASRGAGRQIPRHFLLALVVILLGVHLPDILLIAPSRNNVVHRSHRRQHRVILIIVFVHAIASNQEDRLTFGSGQHPVGDLFAKWRDHGLPVPGIDRAPDVRACSSAAADAGRQSGGEHQGGGMPDLFSGHLQHGFQIRTIPTTT